MTMFYDPPDATLFRWLRDHDIRMERLPPLTLAVYRGLFEKLSPCPAPSTPAIPLPKSAA